MAQELKRNEIINLLTITARSLHRADNSNDKKFIFDDVIVIDKYDKLAIIGLDTIDGCLLVGDLENEYQNRLDAAWRVDVTTFNDKIVSEVIAIAYKTIKNYDEYLKEK